MTECILCNEDDKDTMLKHHTIPTRLLPNWEETMHLCQKCHKKVHKYIIKDLVLLVEIERKELKYARRKLHALGIDYVYW